MRLFGFGKVTEIDNGCKMNRFVMVEKYGYCRIIDNKEDESLVTVDTGSNKLNKKIGKFALEEIEKHYCPNNYE